ncbi:2-dehydro-3-deoxygalactonokinase [Paracoccus isoporae]|uniref:2-dehydro-3-deoxygalactonokinase n=1 Tax=Paracoccus isoporae TaxID=591205 RepID=A0A1G7DE79_9RHOB|nr:2-dehydro-3-deoxygalactonokinase [Paracoccus isoporae]SDE49821.1 2-dehydro-3-deoxygalactonokinase [Paracoccus isoporae]
MSGADADWIAADWGSSNLRVWAMRGSEMLEARGSDRGMGALSAPADFAAELDRITEGWPDVTVIACGMVGARQGWVEVPYASTPCPAIPALTEVPDTQGARRVRIAGGVMQTDPPDVMRGEETQIAGVLAASPDFDGVICLPGTHTKWARISAGEIVHFQTVMTGEIFALLARQSVLRHSLGDAETDPQSEAFADALATALSQPHQAWARLFRLRAAGLVAEGDPAATVARLSGTLIGLDLGAARAHWLGQQVLIIGASRLARLYEAALKLQGVAPIIGDADTATRAGLLAAWRKTGARP